ncbi:glycosyl hydrolase family 28-related protein [Pelagicoccus sp. SDUM812002]|uniref:glycosyl hydrolase family 28-related protein n=1 Tax=Pelagicoccus sp. SDUM812002 TaxID=3041266 RepID=UPI0028127009|nr:glycosyl hydrolase family 28-related protein [Pelagicoccus sp. SDUM812002]
MRTISHFAANITLLAFFAFASAGLRAQEPWRSILYPEDWRPPASEDGLDFETDSFLQDLSYAGYRMGSASLSADGAAVFDVVEAFGADPTGTKDSTLAIQEAIDAAKESGGGVILLPEGSYRLSIPEGQDQCLLIESSNIVLRGEGVGRTYLFNTSTEMRHRRVIRVRSPESAGWTAQRSEPIPLARDELGPTRVLQLATIDGLAVGDWIVVHNPATEAFIQDLNMGPGLDGVDWTDTIDSLRGLLYLRQVTAVEEADNLIEIDIPTRWSLKTRDGAVVYKTESHLSDVALEAFSIGNKRITKTGWEESDYSVPGTAAYDAHDSYLIEMRSVVDGWMQNVSSYNPGNDNDVHSLSNGVLLDWCRNVTLYRLRFLNAQYGGGGGNGYMIRLNAASESLIAECEVGHSRHGFVMWRMQNSGNVVTRCYDHDSGIQLADTVVQSTAGRGSDHHGIFSHSNLFDGNRLERSYLEAAYRGDSGSSPEHGISSSQCVYWNIEGVAYHESADYVVHSQQYGQGYVIGTRGEASGVRLSEKRPNSDMRTNPLDFVEGEGLGDTLVPASLYQDQLLKRTNGATARLWFEKTENSLKFEWEESPSFPWALEHAEDLEQWAILLEGAAGVHEEPLPVGAQFFRLSVQR